jgi:hypothetical protein
MKVTVRRNRMAIAKRVRAGMEALMDELDYNTMQGLCMIGAHALARAFRRAGYRARIVGGWQGCSSHYWVECEGEWWDVTGDQFRWIPRAVVRVPIGHQYYRCFRSVCVQTWVRYATWEEEQRPTPTTLRYVARLAA